MTAVARYATPRSPDRATYGPAIGKVGAAFRRAPQAWQRQVLDVGTELLPDGSWAYTTVVVHVQRQAGKTTLLGPKNVHRVITRQAVKTWLTAQTRQDGRDTWRDVAELVRMSPLAPLLAIRRSNGSEELACSATGSSFRVFAPTEDALHGKANESVDVDEAWAFDTQQGLALQQAILPTFTTTGGQLWLTSTAGTAASGWLRAYVERGRAAVEAGARQGIAYFEWSLPPVEAELVTATLSELQRAGYKLDELLAVKLDAAIDLVLAAHPGEFVKRDAVRDAAMSMPPGEFLRAYGNVWTLTSDQVISDHAWQACRDPQLAMPEPGGLALAFDVAVDRSSAAISAAWRTDGKPAIDAVDERPGTGWLVERIEQLAQRWRCRQVGYDAVGPALDIADELRRRGVVEPVPTTTADYTAACAGLLAVVDSNQLRHAGRPALDQAVAAAARRELGDRWAWSRRTSAGSIAPLVAGTVALWQLDHKPAPPAAPVIVSAAPKRPDAGKAASPVGRTLTL